MSVGFIGLGIMGRGMAHNLLKNGVPLRVYNRTKTKAAPLVDEGAEWVEKPSAMLGTGIVFTMLSDPEAVREVALGADGFLDQLRPGALWIDCSTVHPRFSREMAAEAARRQIRFMDAPVAGTKPQAENGELIIFAGGSEEDLAQCRPYMQLMSSSIRHVGGQGMGSSLKMVINSLLASAMATFSESVALGRALGLSEETLFDVLIGGPVVAPFIAAKQPKIVNDDYSAHFPLKWMMKDLQMVAEAAGDVEAAIPLAKMTEDVYAQAVEAGLAESDFSAIFRFYNDAG